MSGGWVPLDADAWPAVAEALSAAGRPWPRAAVLFDLRWWADRERLSGGRLLRPGRPALCARWGWGEKAARLAIADEQAWGDPSLREPAAGASQGPARGQPRASEGPAKGQRGASEGPEFSPRETSSARAGASQGPARGQPRASEGPAEGQPGADAGPATKAQTPTPTQTPSPHPPQGAPPGAARAGGAEQVPSWLRAWAQHGPVPERVDPAVLGRALLAATAAVTGREVEAAWGGQQRQPWAAVGEGPLRLHGHADATLSPAHRLWESLGRPDLEAWLADVELLARAARECHAPVFAREIRGQGEAGRADHSRSLRTVLAVDRFGDRLEVARRWVATLAPTAPPPALRLVTPEEAEARAAEQAALARLTDAVGDRGLEDLYASLAEACRPCETWRPALAELGRAPDPRGAALALERELAREARAAGRVAGGGR